MKKAVGVERASEISSIHWGNFHYQKTSGSVHNLFCIGAFVLVHHYDRSLHAKLSMVVRSY